MEKRKIRVFISSPGDVYQERITAKKVIAELNKIYSKHIEIEPILWEDMPLLASSTFQDGINDIIKQYQIDVAVFILWSRLGTPLNSSYVKPDGSPYLSGTEYELGLMMDSFEKTGSPRILVYVKNEPLKNRLMHESEENLQEVIAQHRAVKSFIKKHFHDEESGSNYAYTSFGGNVSFESRLKQHLKGIIEDFLGCKINSIKWHRNPFVGLNSFDYTESDIFFGRERAVNDIMANTLTHIGEGHMPSIILLGESGSGKSSLVQAGVVPMTDYLEGQRGKMTKIIPSLLGDKIYDSFIDIFLSSYSFLKETPIAEELKCGIKDDYNFAHLQYALTKADQDKCQIFFFDQFEELFSDANISKEQRTLFLRLIRGLVGTRQVFVIISMRNDFYGYFHIYKDFNIIKETATLVYDMPFLGSSDYASIIREPAKLAGIEWEIDSNGQSLDEIIINDAIELKSLPLIQFSLYELYKIKNDENLISFENYFSIGGIKGAFLSYANTIYKNLTKEEVLAFNDILSKTITISNLESETFVRKTSLLKDVEISTVHKTLIKKLVDAHILVSSKNSNGDATITLVHEMLIQSWPVIEQWIESEKYFIKESGYYEKRALQWVESGSKSGGIIKDDEQLLRAEYFDCWWSKKSATNVRNYIKASLDYKRRLGITRWSLYTFAYLGFCLLLFHDFTLTSLSDITTILGVILLFVPLCLNLILHIIKRPTYKVIKAQFITWVSFLVLNITYDIVDRQINPQDYLLESSQWLNYMLYAIFVCATISSYQQYRLRSWWKDRKFKIPLFTRIFNKEKYKIAYTFINSFLVVIFILGIIFGWNGLSMSNRFDTATGMADYLTQILENSKDELSSEFFYNLNDIREVYLREVYPDSVDAICDPNIRKEELARTFYYRSMPDSAMAYLAADNSIDANILRANIYTQSGSYDKAARSLEYDPETLFTSLHSNVTMNILTPASIYLMNGDFVKAQNYLEYAKKHTPGLDEPIFLEYWGALYSIATDPVSNNRTYYNYTKKAQSEDLQEVPVEKLLLAGILSEDELMQIQKETGIEPFFTKTQNTPDYLLGEWYSLIEINDYSSLCLRYIAEKNHISFKAIVVSTIDDSLLSDATLNEIQESTIFHFISPVTFDDFNNNLYAISANLFEGYNNSTLIHINNYSEEIVNASIYNFELMNILYEIDINLNDFGIDFYRVDIE